MSDVFISYAHADREAASRLADRLKAQGWTVFWDSHLRTGDEWRKVVEAEVRQACCVVVLFSTAAQTSSWVQEEAEIGKRRGVLLPVLLGLSEPPFGFGGIQASNLTDWDGVSESRGLVDLIRAITMLCGGHESVMLLPLQLVIVVGWPKKWPALGATINMNCRFVNKLERTVSIRRLEASAAGPNALSYDFVWTIPYDTVGYAEHVRRIEPTAAIDVPTGRIERGIQLQAPAFNDKVAWPSGVYSFEILGWTDHKRGEPANLRTQFEISISAAAAGEVKRWLEADDATWVRQKPSDNAIGVQVVIGKIRAGLPTI